MKLDLIEEIKKYIKNDRINYAILIDGEWGSGKTYFIKEELIPKLNEEIKNNGNKPTIEYKSPIYISLYGVDSLDSISAQMYLQITGKYSKVASLGLSTIKIFKPDLDYSKIFDVINENTNLKNYVLIFDDLERANLDINMCLAYINSFVEHHGIKVIIIANENEIGKIDFNKNYELKLLSTMQSNINYVNDINYLYSRIRLFGTIKNCENFDFAHSINGYNYINKSFINKFCNNFLYHLNCKNKAIKFRDGIYDIMFSNNCGTVFHEVFGHNLELDNIERYNIKAFSKGNDIGNSLISYYDCPNYEKKKILCMMIILNVQEINY